MSGVAAQAAESAAAAAGAGAGAERQDLTGVWLKDKEASESMDEVCEVMELGWLMRKAISLIRGVEIKQGAEHDGDFHFIMLPVTGLGWFKIKEKYPMSGQPAQGSRRDMRKGHHTGRLERSPTSGGLMLIADWDDPLGGHFEDHMYLPSPDTLHIDTLHRMKSGREVKYRSVYRRKK